MKLKKSLIYLSLILIHLNIVALDSYAQLATKGLLVELKDGTKQTFLFSSLPKVTFSHDVCFITASNLTTEYEMDNVQRISIMGKDITDVEDSIEHINIDLSNHNTVIINGLTPDTVVKIYDIKGFQLVSTKVDSFGTVVISLVNLQNNTVYIINSQEITFKLYKK
ncbi:MAG: hypothetical protein K2J12_09140 [Muribaculaceae bacterium]|nr:hypothetical protein [Muribaculaceae bacterium]